MENLETVDKKSFTEKAKEFGKKHWKKAAVIAGGAACFILGEKYTEYCVARGLCRIHNAGYIDFFDGKGNKVTVEEGCKLIHDNM